MADLNPAPFRALFGPDSTFQGLDMQGSKMISGLTYTSKDDPMLHAISLNLDVVGILARLKTKDLFSRSLLSE